jgi:anoctamin-10
MSRRVYVGVATTGLFTAAVGLLTLALLYYRLEMIVALSHGPLAALAPLAPGVATGVLISCADAAWRAASVRLTRWENHRTDRSHDNHLVLKRFAFQFVSNYSSLLYIGFVKPHTPGDACLVGADGATPDCMMELRSQLIGIVLTKATVMQLVEVGVPYAAGRLKLWMQRAARESFEEGASAAERARVGAAAAGSGDDDKYLNEGRLAVADDLDDYGEVTIMYGYFCLFGLCWPLAALVQLVDVSVESRSDVFKIVAVSQMPDARDAGDIGLWIPIMEFLRTLSIITNASLVIFTGRALDDVLPAGWDASPVLAFLVLEHLLFCVKWAISSTVNEVPGRTRRLLARQEFLIARCFGHGWKSHFRPRDRDARPPPDQFAPSGGADAP